MSILKLGKFKKFPIWKNPKIFNLENYENSKNFQSNKLLHILSVRVILKNIKKKNRFENKKSNNLTFVMLIFKISSFSVTFIENIPKKKIVLNIENCKIDKFFK